MRPQMVFLCANKEVIEALNEHYLAFDYDTSDLKELKSFAVHYNCIVVAYSYNTRDNVRNDMFNKHMVVENGILAVVKNSGSKIGKIKYSSTDQLVQIIVDLIRGNYQWAS